MSDRPTIGSSDAAAVLGLSPWAGPWDVWARLTGLVPRYDTSDTGAQVRGRVLEPALLVWYAQEIGRPVLPGPALGAQPWIGDIEWMHARPDGWVPHTDVALAPGPDPAWLVEAKTARYLDPEAGWGEPGTDQVPRHYAVQCAWQMAVGMVDRCDLVVLGTMAEQIRVYTLRRNPAIERALVDRCGAWYARHIEGGEPPPLDGSAGAVRALSAQHRDARRGSTVEATPDALDAVAELGRLRARQQTLTDKRRALENRIRVAVGDRHHLHHADRRIATVTIRRDGGTRSVKLHNEERS